MKAWLIALLVAVVLFAASQFISVLVIPPIGALPEGATVLIWRLQTMNFIDSADAWCARRMDGVSLLCRAGVLARVGSQSSVLVRFPYSETLYLWSTGGRTYSSD